MERRDGKTCLRVRQEATRERRITTRASMSAPAASRAPPTPRGAPPRGAPLVTRAPAPVPRAPPPAAPTAADTRASRSRAIASRRAAPRRPRTLPPPPPSALDDATLCAAVKQLRAVEAVEPARARALDTPASHAAAWAAAAGLTPPRLASILAAGAAAEAAIRARHRGIAVHSAKRVALRVPSVPLDDLILEGEAALLAAAAAYDPAIGPFGGLAGPSVRGAILNVANVERRLVTATPSVLSGAVVKMRTAETELAKRLGRDPTRAEMMARVRLSPAEAAAAFSYHTDDVSFSALEATVSDTTDELMGEDDVASEAAAERTDVDSASSEVWNAATAADVKAAVQNLLSTLPSEEALCLALRYRLGEGDGGKRGTPRVRPWTEVGARLAPPVGGQTAKRAVDRAIMLLAAAAREQTTSPEALALDALRRVALDDEEGSDGGTSDGAPQSSAVIRRAARPRPPSRLRSRSLLLDGAGDGARGVGV